jgi:hypothetical protein
MKETAASACSRWQCWLPRRSVTGGVFVAIPGGASNQGSLASRRPQRYAHLAGDRLAWAGRRSRRTGRSASLGRPLPALGRRLRGVVAHRQLAPTAVIEPSGGQRA